MRAARPSASGTVSAAGTTRDTRPGDEGDLGIEDAAAEDDVHGQRRADGPHQALGPTGAGHDPDGDLGLPEAGVVAGHDDVADERQLAATAKGVTTHRGDERDADRGDAVPAVEVALAGEPGRGLFGQLEDVGSGRERAIAGAGQDDGVAAGSDSSSACERGRQVGQDLEAEGVARLRPIDGHEGNAGIAIERELDPDVAGVGHGVGQGLGVVSVNRGLPWMCALRPSSIHEAGRPR